MPPNRRRKPAKFYQEDIVQLIDNPKAFGIVLRCWHDAEDVPTPPEQLAQDPLLRPLEYGEVGVSFYPTNGGPDHHHREILPEAKLTLVDRMYQPGDFLKRSIDDVRSGVVTSIEVKGRLEHAISGAEIPGWKTMSDVECYIDVDMGDYVVYDDWVGQIVEMFDEAVVEMESGSIVRLPELSARLTVGERGPNILPPPTPGMQSIIGFLLGNVRPSSQDTVLSVKRTVLAIAWLAINQSLDPAEAVRRERPSLFWHGPNLAKLTLVRRRAEQAMHVGDRVVMKGAADLPVTTHGRADEPPGLIEVRTLVVTETRTTVNVLWQDGTRETLDARDTVPYLNPDEYDCWPGDHVMWKTEEQKRHVIVQSVNSRERVAQVRPSDKDAVEVASVLELDPHGGSDWSAVSPVEGLGLHRGEFVFVHKEGSSNGADAPMVPRIGELEEWVRESPVMQVQENGQLGGWRRVMAEIGNDIATRRGKDPSIEEGTLKRPQRDDTSLNWFGEVVDLRLDGTLEVMLPDSTVTVLPLERLTRLYDGLEQLEDMWGDEASQGEGSYYDEQEEILNEFGLWEPADAEDEGDDWVDSDADGMDIDSDVWGSVVSNATTELVREPTPPDGGDEGKDGEKDKDGDKDKDNTSSEPHTLRPASPDVPKDAVDADEAEAAENPHWKRFDVLPSAPVDHAFFSSPPAQPSRSFLGRLTKEYRVLSSSLPDTILVRAYEDRTDLLRCLIIGPENTPYEDAPFVIDWRLDGDFPHSPPIAHFLSWTNGNGRVNPNLYEEGKVCLSILGTWAGDKTETWSAARSSLLQAFVSIQGLVLVKEPWFCEPAYEKLRGTEEGIVNSRLYSEKAYVLSRGFVRRALEIPLGGLADEVGWMYYTNGKLQKVVRDARALIEKSRAAPAPESEVEVSGESERAVPRLSGGGIITLERTLTRLQALLDAPPR